MKSSLTKVLLLLLAWMDFQVSAQESYSHFVLQTGTSFTPETNGIWTLADCDGDGILDLVYIKTMSVQSGMVELHYASGAVSGSGQHFDGALVHFATYVAASDVNKGIFHMIDYDGDGKADLVFIKTTQAEAKSVEVHVMSAASNYQKTIYNSGTCYTYDDAKNGMFFMSELKYLIYLKMKNTDSDTIEINWANADTNFKTLEEGPLTAAGFDTGFSPKDYATYWVDSEFAGGSAVAGVDDVDHALYQIKTGGGVKNVEVHSVVWIESENLGGGFDATSVFQPENAGYWMMANWTSGAYLDLVYIKVGNTGTNTVEVHIAAYQ